MAVPLGAALVFQIFRRMNHTINTARRHSARKLQGKRRALIQDRYLALLLYSCGVLLHDNRSWPLRIDIPTLRAYFSWRLRGSFPANEKPYLLDKKATLLKQERDNYEIKIREKACCAFSRNGSDNPYDRKSFNRSASPAESGALLHGPGIL